MRRRPKRTMARRAMSRLTIVGVREVLESESSRTTKLWMAFIVFILLLSWIEMIVWRDERGVKWCDEIVGCIVVRSVGK